MAEVWKPVPSLPGVMASSDGRILLPPRHVPLPNGGIRLTLPKPTTGTITSAGKGAAHQRRSYTSRHFGSIRIHQAVCEAFHGPKPFDGAVVIHLDEDGLNNRPSNLKWGTQKENLNMPKLKAYHRSRTGADSPRAKWAAKRRAA